MLNEQAELELTPGVISSASSMTRFHFHERELDLSPSFYFFFFLRRYFTGNRDSQGLDFVWST